MFCFRKSRFTVPALGAVVVIVFLTTSALPVGVCAAERIDGFLAPLRSLDICTAESGVLQQIFVREGESVVAGQALALLDDAVFAALLAEADFHRQSRSRLKAAEAEQKLRQERCDALKLLLDRGSARQEELDRAFTDLAIAKAQTLAAIEERALRELEYERAKAQWQRRTIRAPMNGVVVKRLKDEGEFIGASDPRLLTLMQLDQLLATFAVPSSIGRHLKEQQKVRVRVTEANVIVDGVIESVPAVIEGKSGTMRLEVRIDNSKRRFLSGEPCTLLLDHAADTASSPARLGPPVPKPTVRPTSREE